MVVSPVSVTLSSLVDWGDLPRSLTVVSFFLLEWRLWSGPQPISKAYFPSGSDWVRGGHVTHLEPMIHNKAFARPIGKMVNALSHWLMG